MLNSFYLKRVLTLLAISYVFFFLGNSLLSLTDPDEVFYALTAKEMAANGQWLTPYIFDHPQFEKPIFLYWLLLPAFDQWGITPFSARFFPALFASLGVLAVYGLGLLGFKNERRAFWSAVVLCSAGLYVGMGKTLFTDTIFSVFILCALLSFYCAFAIDRRKTFGILAFFTFAALATLTKGPLGLLLPALTIVLFLLYRRRLDFLANWWVLAGFGVFLAVALPWYAFMFKTYGHDFTHEFFYNDHLRRLLSAEHKGNDRFYFYPFTMLLGLFPWTLFLAAALFEVFKKLKTGVSEFEHFLLSWILVVFFIFQCSHSKLASYILPLFPALALLTGQFIEEAFDSAKGRLLKAFLVIMAAFWAILGIAVVVAYPVYKTYLSSIEPVFFLSACLIAFAGGLVALVLKERLALATGLLCGGLLPFLWTAFLIKADIQPYFCTHDASMYLPHYSGTKTTILSSKPYARGVRYYTGQEVAVLDINGKNYFSPHPVTILSTQEQLIAFLQQQKLTYALVKKGGYKAITELSPSEFTVHVHKKLGYTYIVSIESLPSS